MQILDELADLTLDQENDQFLIRAFQQAGYRGHVLRRLNLCRLFFKVTTVSDIATGCGKCVTQAAWTGQFDSSRFRKYDWPKQGNTFKADWTVWQAAVHKSLCGRQQVLQSQLGRWLHEGLTHWFYAEDEERRYHKDGDMITYYPRAPGNASRAAKWKFHQPQQVKIVPQIAHQATVEILVRNIVHLTGWALF
jgi:hypothetical protein